MLQIDALNLLKLGKNIFLTGAAGSGKTYLLNQYIRYLKQHSVGVAVTASTGIAATHLCGTTIHTWSGIGVKDSLSQMDLDNLSKNFRVKRNYKKTKVLIIDEISMLHRYQLDMVDAIARFFLDAEKPFGGMQIILCGDFFQLPPVAAASATEKQFAFEASSWALADFHVCYLQEQHRQGQDPLLQVLNDIRSGTAGEHTKVPLRTRYKKEPQGATKPTQLYSRNVNVDAINNAELAKLPGTEMIFNMSESGFPALVAALKKSCLAPSQLKLKIGAEVMFIKNDSLGQYVNGTRGVIIGFDSTDGWPLVKTFSNYTLMVMSEEWNIEEHGIIQATIKQVPIRLAWAITIHKSQGMTLDAAEIDLGDAFEPGMGYVALSRVRSLQGLKLMNLNEMALKVHPKILEQDKVFKTLSLEVAEQLHSIPKEVLEKVQVITRHLRFEAHTSKEAFISPVQDGQMSCKEEVMKETCYEVQVMNEPLHGGYEADDELQDVFSKMLGDEPPDIDKKAIILKAARIETVIGPMIAMADDDALYLLEFFTRRGLEREVMRLRSRGLSIITGNAQPLTSIEAELNAYFAGSLTQFNTPYRVLGTPFQQQVWQALCQIPFGETKSYAEQSMSLGKPNSHRAVANANGANQLAIMIPCHRVIASNGTLGGYGGGLAVKKWLIEHEKRHKKGE